MSIKPKVLIYIDPRTDLDNPIGRATWVRFGTELLASFEEALRPKPNQIRLVCNSWIAKTATGPMVTEDNICQIDSLEILEFFGGNAGRHRNATFLETPNDRSAHEKVANLLREKIGDFIPDLIVTFVSEPALSLAYPNALLLHHEVGAFSRPPMPKSFRLDPCGLIANSWPAVLQNQLRALGPSKASRDFMTEVRAFVKDEVLEPYNPFKNQLDALSSRFRKIWLLPLGPPLFNYHYPVPGSPVNDTTQFDMIAWLMPFIPEDETLLVIEHPLMPFLTAAQIECMQWSYPNISFMPETASVDGASQFLTPNVDGLITVNSSLGYQAAFFNKELVALSDQTFLSTFADAVHPDYILKNGEPRSPRQVDAIIHHLLTHYFVPEKLFRNTDFISNRVRGWLKGEVKTHSMEFFSRTAPDEVLLDIYKTSCSIGPPRQLFPLSKAMPQSQLDMIRNSERRLLWPSRKAKPNAS